MFKVENYEVYFEHRPHEQGILAIEDETGHFVQGTPYYGKTFCYIEEDGEPVLIGEAYCSIVDRFDKVKGRKVSLTRAIEGLDKETRTKFWEAYRAVSKK